MTHMFKYHSVDGVRCITGNCTKPSCYQLTQVNE